MGRVRILAPYSHLFLALLHKSDKHCQRHNEPRVLNWLFNLSYLSSKKNATCSGSKFGQLYVVPLVLVQNLTTRWRHQNWFHIWPTCNVISIGSNFGHQVALLALVTNLTTRWRHWHWLQIWPPDGATCISYKFSHQVESLALPHCLGMPYWH